MMRKAYDLIGIAQRAGKATSGTMAVQRSLKGSRACLLIISEDVSENTREVLVRASHKHQVPHIILGDSHVLGHSIGKPFRVALTIDDSGLADAIVKAVKSADM
ncbi:MAG: 50S ribosomal protein L7ae [Syntrophomonadaceae bacterium]|nr:50S ribosomal protein L7ae [Syntrophomonadaceae bacterium]